MTRPYMAPSPWGFLQPKAIGFLLLELSGTAWEQEEFALVELAGRHGYDLVRTLRFTPEIPDPVERLLIIARRLPAQAVVVPTLEHLPAQDLVRQNCHLIAAHPELILPCFDDLTPGR